MATGKSGAGRAATSTSSSGSVQSSSHPHALVEVAAHAHEVIDSIHSKTEKANSAFKFAAGHAAFRKYNWIKATPVLNRAGNLRGVVINARARTAFNFLVKSGEALEFAGKALLIAGVAIEVAKATDRLEAIAHSSGSDSDKAQQFSLAASMIVTRALLSPVVPVTHFVATKAASALRWVHSSDQLIDKVNAADIKVKSYYEAITNDDIVLHAINTHCVFM